MLKAIDLFDSSSTGIDQEVIRLSIKHLHGDFQHLMFIQPRELPILRLSMLWPVDLAHDPFLNAPTYSYY